MADRLENLERVVITGALGNLGWKLLCHLAHNRHVRQIFGLDKAAPNRSQQLFLDNFPEKKRIEMVPCDLADWHDSRWQNVLLQSTAVVHFAARNPFPDANWQEASDSLDMTNNVVLATANCPSIRRFVFASSNHVMGRYLDPPLADSIGPGELTTSLPPAVGATWKTEKQHFNSTIYAVPKIAGERLCKAQSAKCAGRSSFVAVRIGWCQPGENEKSSLSGAGTPKLAEQQAVGSDTDRAERWFREMWLSNRDFTHLFERALIADARAWQNGFALVNGMSANTGMKWSLAEARHLLGYQPKDDVKAE